MQTRKRKKISSRAVRYPLTVLVVGLVIAIAVPMFSDAVDPELFGNAMGRLICTVFFVALVVGLISDLKRRKNRLKDDLDAEST